MRVTTQPATSDLQAVESLKSARERIITELRKVIVGQDEVVDQLLMALFANGHVLLVGVPGLAKTLLISSLARVLDLNFNRIQFTPDLMPSDITGTDVIEEEPATGKRAIRFIRGPVFANIVLADEINRTPPKTQAALLQAMQEKQVTAGGQTFDLTLPFFVLATQNPIELEGTYPLPEAQLDRFMFNVFVDYPSEAEEEKIVATTTSAYEAKLDRVLSGADIIALQKLVRRVPVADHVVRYAVRLARATRGGASSSGGAGAPEFVKQWVSWGAGPRASQYLVLGAKTRAVLMGRFAPGIEDVRAVAPAVLRHRIVTNFSAEAEGIKPDRIIQDLLKTIPTE
ncbi:MAG: MoxR family ATPase [Candidatus Eisenbacteria bacterium]|uniref:MoxR family ATPase n=1 Tax=Eiseniibacteriota bacterium TaxID=2212470 RepID=A0A849SG46_UNCEI|nr:MoxR family ATPase [Candidatus Eisenbacteria bacterium]